jgi:hypothetical protein
MSSWQSFFNQLSKPVNKEIISTSEKICSCNTGCLEFSSLSYLNKGHCNLNSACCAIQIDKHKARTINISLSNLNQSKEVVSESLSNLNQSKEVVSERDTTPIVSLEVFLKRGC